VIGVVGDDIWVKGNFVEGSHSLFQCEVKTFELNDIVLPAEL